LQLAQRAQVASLLAQTEPLAWAAPAATQALLASLPQEQVEAALLA
jgi:hypothetical protein